MKEPGPFTYFLGLKVHQSNRGIVLNRHKYTFDLIEKAGLQHSTPVDTPIEVNIKLRQDEGDPLPNPMIYRQLVGNLIYSTINRPDISDALNLVSQFMTDPRHLHMDAIDALRIIRYLLRTPTRGLFLPIDTSLTLKVYSDADWAGCQVTQRFTTG